MNIPQDHDKSPVGLTNSELYEKCVPNVAETVRDLSMVSGRRREVTLTLPPQPRSRFYGGWLNIFRAARDLLLGDTHTGDDVGRLETRVAAFVGVNHAVAMPQARVGIYFALRALIQPGQKVVLSPYTIHDVINMVICAGGIPVFADIERATCNISVEDVDVLLGDDVGAVLVTHLHGLACNIERIRDLCRACDIPLVEDCAQAFGTRVNNRAVGTFGTAGVFSFGMAKNVNAFYGGMLITDDDVLAQKVRGAVRELVETEAGVLVRRVLFCTIGSTITATPVFWLGTYWLFRYGYLNDIDALNNQLRGEMAPRIMREIPEPYLRRLTPMQARLVLRQIDGVTDETEERLGYARSYHAGLSDIPEIIQPPLREDGSHIYLTYPIQIPDRDDLLRYLMLNLRDLTVQHLVNTADAECYGAYFRDCPNARETANQVLLLPTYPGYGERDVRRNIKYIRRYFGHA